MRLQNITLGLKETITRWAQLLREILKQRVLADDSYERAMRQALARKPFLKTDGSYFFRDEVHLRSSKR